jgi:iron complex outermembrane receptor protein
MNIHRVSYVALLAGMTIGIAGMRPAHAAQTAPEEVIVTARKRTERLVSVPVVITAVGSAELRRRNVVTLDDVARIVPQLIIAPQSGSVQGGEISIRGIQGPDSNPFGDQAVSFNIDGIDISTAAVRRLGENDIDQIEVLKGPQALFFGKDSPGGIVSITTSDPTPKLEAGISEAYDVVANETRTEAYVSGPITDTLTGRLAGYYSNMQGFLNDQTPSNSPYYQGKNNPRERDYAIRGTLKWVPNDQFDARLKLNYGETNSNGPAGTAEFISCPIGERQTGSGAECGTGNDNVNAGSGPVVGKIPGTLNHFGDGANFLDQKQTLISLQMNYRPVPTVTLTSVTGYYNVGVNICQNYENDFSIILPSCNVLQDGEYSQEIRATTSFDFPVNFTGGFYYQRTVATTGSITYLNGGDFDLLGPGVGGPTTPLLVNNYFLKQDGETYSGYLQMQFKPVKQVELDIGGRETYTEKTLPAVYDGGDLGSTQTGPAELIHPPVTDGKFPNFSPEITLSYHPTSNETLYGSYKSAFLSGGFNSSSTDFISNPNLAYGDETIRGFETGAKAELFDRKLRLNGAGYIYKVTGLQVTNFVNATASIRNAGEVIINGVEGDAAYVTPVPGLNIQAASAFNQANYTHFPGAPCYNGETPAEGCTLVDGNPVQNLSHTQIPRAPKWNITGGFNYLTPINAALNVGLSGNVTYSDSYLTDASSDPRGREPGYELVDATLRLTPSNGRWEAAVIGKNLMNTYYWAASANVPFTGSGTGTSAGVLGDRFASVSRGREVILRVSYKFF